MRPKYERIQTVMEFLDWKWAPFGRVPTVAELEEQVERLQQMMSPDSTSIATGGFKISRIKDETGHEQLRVEFILESWDVSNELRELQ